MIEQEYIAAIANERRAEADRADVIVESIRPNFDDDETGDGEEKSRKTQPGKWFMRCPRTWALLLGMVIPLWVLIGVSFAFGYGLAVLEANPELTRNDDVLKNQALDIFQSTSFSGIMEGLPTMCLQSYVSNRTVANIANDLIVDLLPSKADNGDFSRNFAVPPPPSNVTLDNSFLEEFIQANSNTTLDFSELYRFLQDCSASSRPYVRNLIDRVTTTANAILSSSDMTFYWNRCPLKASNDVPNRTAIEGVLQDSVIFQGVSSEYRKNLQPASQSEQYRVDWNNDAVALYFEQLNQTDISQMNVSEAATAKYDIFLNAIEQATGRMGCYPNTVASVWFWFTVMTTIGYGNQVPSTWQGRSLFFTVGFFNILLFGAVAAGAGYVLSSLANDFASRRGIPIESKPWIACIFWAVLLYLWMFVIAYVYQQWKISRLGLDFSLANAYWFSYVSTTTVGLGDLALDPEVLVASDLLTFPILFLISFSFFGSFVSNLTTVVFKPFENQKTLADILKDSGVLLTEEKVRMSREASKSPDLDSSTSKASEREQAPTNAVETLVTGRWANVP